MINRHPILRVLTIAILCSVGVMAERVPKASHGTVYVPASSQKPPFTTPAGAVNQYILSRLVIRNTDTNKSISLNLSSLLWHRW